MYTNKIYYPFYIMVLLKCVIITVTNSQTNFISSGVCYLFFFFCWTRQTLVNVVIEIFAILFTFIEYFRWRNSTTTWSTVIDFNRIFLNSVLGLVYVSQVKIFWMVSNKLMIEHFCHRKFFSEQSFQLEYKLFLDEYGTMTLVHRSSFRIHWNNNWKQSCRKKKRLLYVGQKLE